VRRINPIWLLIAFNVLFFVMRGWVLPEGAIEQFSNEVEASLQGFGIAGYAGIVIAYAVCAFFFIPLLIPINILCGAVYGAWVGTAISLVGITFGSIASTISVRHVFTGMQRTIDGRPAAQKILAQIERYGTVIVILVRLAFVVPYLLQNILLATTKIGIGRLTWLTAVGSLPSAAIYSFLGAGLMQAGSVDELALYLAVPLVLLIAVTVLIRWLNAKYDA
jgi:uncharacterized membrane protein YdjX (TVP38/TMEM64 family)